ncbi:putative DNA topoisomerase [Helianthus annuus]|nr:putative DNA topoisomerase [Helianthus annuus]
MVVTSVKGHLKDMTFLSNVRSFKSYELIELFDVNVDKVPKLESQKSTIGHLRRVVEVCKRLYLLLYCDLEGESIAKEVVEVCQEVNSDLLIRSARFSSLHKSDIKAAFRDAGQINHRFSDAADFRREINLRSGYVFTRFQTSLLSNAYKIHNVLSYGMCQLPTLGFIVEQCEERKNQVWKIKCTHKIVDDTSSLDGR